MNAKQLLVLGAPLLTDLFGGRALAQQPQGQYVQLAEIEVDPAGLESYKAAVREQIEAAMTEKIVKSLKLVRAAPIMLGAKPQ
jgi:hypothetical protein